MKTACGIALALLIAAAAIALSPTKAGPYPTFAGMSPQAAKVFSESCKDCHSNATEWPWYSRIPPIRMGIAADVNRGRKAWNLSEWSSYSRGRKLGFLAAITADVSSGNMPPRAYRWLHRNSAPSASGAAELALWAAAERNRLRSASSRLAVADPLAAH